jgi:hypothetical protein
MTNENRSREPHRGAGRSDREARWHAGRRPVPSALLASSRIDDRPALESVMSDLDSTRSIRVLVERIGAVQGYWPSAIVIYGRRPATLAV